MRAAGLRVSASTCGEQGRAHAHGLCCAVRSTAGQGRAGLSEGTEPTICLGDGNGDGDGDSDGEGERGERVRG